ncbi:hypothetical protein QC764_0040290 [Podospora pseudoanserina]|uniref:DUF7587 domain-containing protein n=1 Tax=Podospora pseudoanserina TaxID=2609844 RepID=A0ABR0IIQ3_9PEZI|nr:hypothetical protein QC764_0040290 [Podospora pseudoanserina]
MDSVHCSHKELPSYLYRIQGKTTQTQYDTSEGLEARDTTTLFGRTSGQDKFSKAVYNQFDWYFEGRTQFISFFSSKDHATNWGHKLKKWRRGSRSNDDWSILTIDTSCLENTYVFKLSTVIDELGVQIPQKAGDAHKDGAYFCLYRVPPCAIVSKKTGSETDEFDSIGR